MKKSWKIFFAFLIQLILILAIPSESYAIHQTDSTTGKVIEERNSFGKLLKKGINLVVGLLSIKEIGFVSAQIEEACCPDTCDNVIADYGECSEELIQTSCEETERCQRGCCVDTEEGTCTVRAPKEKCELGGNEWTSDATCSTNTCKKGCCILGNNFRFVTQKTCEKISLDKMNFKQLNYQECANYISSQEEGACVLALGNCKFETDAKCKKDKGIFYTGYLCSYEALKTVCEKQASVGCVEGKNEIYWFDSCGNRENIYSSDKIASWNGGIVLPKEKSCNSDENNADSTSCGNCATIESMCYATKIGEKHVVGGNFICKDLSCKNAPDNVGTKDRTNGEKWCLFDGYIGDGKDTVGSEYYLASCINGEVEIDRTGEYRTSLCQQRTIEGELGSYTTASSVPNQAVNCHKITNAYFESDMKESDHEDMVESCNKETHCELKKVDISKYFKFDICVPKYPGGDLLKDRFGGICQWASRECKVYYEKNLFGYWECKENCECESPEFARQMNELCISIGDCGSNVNYIGKGTDSVKIVGRKGFTLDEKGEETETPSSEKGKAPTVYSWKNYIQYAEVKEGQFIEPLDVQEKLEGILGKGYTASELYDWIGLIPGGLAIGIYSFSKIFPTLMGELLAPTTLGAFLWPTMIIAAGVDLGFLAAQIFDRSPEAATYLMITGGIAGGGLAATLLLVGSFPGIGLGLAAPLTLVSTTLFLIGLLSGYGKRETRIVEFKCQPWVAPNGGDDCEKCNADPTRPCTKYRCESLGQLCQIKNENEENPICISLPRDNVYPIISAGEVKSKGHEFQNENRADWTVVMTGCFEEFEDAWFTLNTDEYSQCQYSFSRQTVPEYDLMNGESPLEENLFAKEHNFYFKIPTINDENIYDVHEIGDGVRKEGSLDVYVKCQDGQQPPNYDIKEYVVKMCVQSGPDENEVNYAKIKTEPLNGALLKYGTKEIELKIWTDEKVELCKYDDVGEKSYENMRYSFVAGASDYRGWLNSAILTNLVPGKNTVYIKCKDVSGNINSKDFEYNLEVSKSELKIDSVSFSYGVKKINSGEIFEVGLEPISVGMEVKTSGGSQNGKATCLWGSTVAGSKELFKSTFSNLHKQTLTPRFSGKFDNYIYCHDDAENGASVVGEFEIVVDSSPPQITRAFKEDGNLQIATDELAKCYFSLDGCDFSPKDGIAMTPTFSETHSTAWNSGITYNIKCEDVFGNVNPNCAIKIVPSI